MPRADVRRRPAASSVRKGGAPERRRALVVVGVAFSVAVVIMASWFPLGALVSQRRAVSASAAELRDLKAQDKVLSRERQHLSSPEEISRLARQHYQLVQPGQKLVQVLPGSGAPSALGGAPSPGDPGLAPVVKPSAVALLPSGAAAAQSERAKPAAASQASGPGLLRRILDTLEFWKG